MTMQGFDYAWGYGPGVPAAVKRAGGLFVVRYIGTSSKCLTAAEAKALQAAGLAIGLVYETTGTTFSGGAAAGQADGAAAKAAAEKLGVPAGAPIYFAIDTDTSAYSIVRDYLKGCAEACAPYAAKLYAGYHVIEAVAVEGQWQTYAWSGGQVSAYADLYQYQNGVTVGGVDMDKCRTLGATLTNVDGWLMPAKTAPVAPAPNPVVKPVAASRDKLRLAGNSNARAAAAVKYEKAEAAHPLHSWKDLCASLVRNAYGVDISAWALFKDAKGNPIARTAAAAWGAVPKSEQHSWYNPPVGVPVFWTGGSSGAGHVAIADGQGNVWSNDFGPSGYIGDGRVRLVPIASISAHDGALKYAGWSETYLGARVYN